VLRHTPAGVPVIEFSLGHVSEQVEAGAQRRVECEINAVVLGSTAHLLVDAALGSRLRATGFLAARSLKNRNAVLHVNEIEFQEGTGNGIQTA
jgi:primosomal replication protein N